MKIWTWHQLEKEFKKHPEQLKAFKELGTNYSSFEDWLTIDIKKCDIVAEVIGCQCAEDLKEQQQKNMEYRQSVCNTFDEWMKKISSNPCYGAVIHRITKRFARQKRCHRNYGGKKAGVRCYCDEHNH